ncbi:ferredoxin [Nocardia sp. JW2]|uniref:ferredoxin n=1 Tax=Nocardia sp. JW2 TaxID=3450738 RepID=UPI003F432F31
MTSVPIDLNDFVYLGDKWRDRHWMNVPGPFYTGQTDTCWAGRTHAPSNVLYGGEYYNEFVYRQPKSAVEVECLLEAAAADPFDGYAWDGDLRWTPAAVRAWRSGRGTVTEDLFELLADYTKVGALLEDREVAEGVRKFLIYLATDLETDLRRYVFRLENGRYPDADDPLPSL